MSFSEDEKENVFNYMDKGRNKVVDYKTFLAIINGDGKNLQSEKFDWV